MLEYAYSYISFLLPPFRGLISLRPFGTCQGFTGLMYLTPPNLRVPVCFYACSLQHHSLPTDITLPSVGVTGGAPLYDISSCTLQHFVADDICTLAKSFCRIDVAKIHTLFVLHRINTFFNTSLTFIYILHKKHKNVQCSINYIILYVYIYENT